jgi:hypothetical protein
MRVFIVRKSGFHQEVAPIGLGQADGRPQAREITVTYPKRSVAIPV